MRPLHIIMPMAGEGSRFAKAGWTTPKPLIELNGQPLFKHAISSVFAEDIPMKYSFIVRQEHIDKYAIDKGIKSFLPEANIFSVLKTTRGAVETCLMAESAIADEDAVIVMDCDLEFRSQRFLEIIRSVLVEPSAVCDQRSAISNQTIESPANEKFTNSQILDSNKVTASSPAFPLERSEILSSPSSLSSLSSPSSPSSPSSLPISGALVSFESSEPRYSYAALDEDGYVKKTAEKEVISNHALCGAYFFSSGKRFKEVAHQLLNEPEFKKPEYYVSLLYNYLLEAGEKVLLAPMEEYYSYGTPEELGKYL